MTVQELINELEKIRDKSKMAVDAKGNPIDEVWDMAATKNVAVWFSGI